MTAPEHEETRITLEDQRPNRTCGRCGLTVPATVDVCPNDGTKLAETVQNSTALLAGRYQFIDVIGEGGMSVVYKARHPDLNKTVAVKMLHSHMMGLNAAARFAQEARAVSTLDHRNVIRVHDSGATADGQPFIVMDYLEGQDLSDRIRNAGPMDPLEAVDLFEQICDGLSHAHKKGIVHRDLKPSNVMLCRDDHGNIEPKIVDFGIAKVAIDGATMSGPGGALTRTGEVIGSPPYMSPEQCKGSGMDARSDIYSLGVLMYEVLTGSVPFGGDNFMEIVFKHMEEPAPTLRANRSEVTFPPRLEAVIARCLAKPRPDRFQTVEEVKTALREVRADILDPSRGRGKRMAIFAASTIFGIALVGAGIYVGMHFARGEETTRVHRPIQTARFDDAEAIDPAAIDQLLSANKRGHVLALDHPSVTDAFMPAVAEQADLKEINLDGASVSDVGVAALGKSQARLEKLDLEHLDITDKSIRFIKHFPLKYLNIQQTNVTDAGLAEIAEIKSLCDLEMARVLCTPKGLEALTALPKLDTIDVSMIPGFTDQWLKPIGQYKSLRKLDIEANNVRGPGLAYLKDLKKLDFLRARGVKFDPGGLTHLPLLPSLARLELPAATVTKKDIAWLAKLPALKTLELHETSVDDDTIAPLVASKSLENLDLHKTDVTASGIKRLKAIPGLQRIDVRSTKIDPSEFGSLQSYMEPIKLVND